MRNILPYIMDSAGIIYIYGLMVFSCPPLVTASPWLSCAKRAECWAAVLSGLGMSAKNAGGGPGGGGRGGGQGPSEDELNSEGWATGPWAEQQSEDITVELLVDEMINFPIWHMHTVGLCSSR